MHPGAETRYHRIVTGTIALWVQTKAAEAGPENTQSWNVPGINLVPPVTRLGGSFRAHFASFSSSPIGLYG